MAMAEAVGVEATAREALQSSSKPSGVRGRPATYRPMFLMTV